MTTPPIPNGSKTPSPGRKHRRIRRIVRWLERGFALFGALVALYWLTMDVSVVISPSMAPTLQGSNVDDGDRVVTEKVSHWFRRPRRWEVITFLNDNGEKRMKRVIGLPGETVQMPARGELLIDGKTTDWPAWLDRNHLRFGNLVAGNAVSCGNGYYVLGDDLKDSDDSRFNGPVPAGRIIGRAWFITWPWSRIGWVR